jgi:hypothetical protein
MNNVSEIAAQEAEKIKAYLEGIKENLTARRGIADKSLLMAEEETILNSILNPDRGDVKITLMRDRKDSVIFLNNQRDPENPFVVMSFEDHKHFSGRRALNPSYRTLKEGEFGLFISGSQDRELLANTGIPKFTFYSVQFMETAKPVMSASTGTEYLKSKPLAECSVDEKFTIYKRSWDFDSRLSALNAELFSIEMLYARYKSPVKKETLNIEPAKYKVMIHQMIKDVYPYNMKVLLRRDYPAEHETKMQEVMDILKTVINKTEEKSSFAGEGEYGQHLKEVILFVKDIMTNDPKLEKVV